MDESDFLKEQARQCRAAALRAQSRPERMGLMQLARHYDAEVGRLGLGDRRRGEAAQAPLAGGRY